MNIDFLIICLIYIGFIVGLGAVSVIDLHGFFAQTSVYWTRATIQTHKITKPLIWVGFAIKLVGIVLFIQTHGLIPPIKLVLVILSLLILNGLYLSFNISPRLLALEQTGITAPLPHKLQSKIFVSFIISFVGWWTNFFVLSYSLLNV